MENPNRPEAVNLPHALKNKIAIKRTAENLRTLKEKHIMQLFNPATRSKLAAEKAVPASVITVTNSAGQVLVPVTRRDKSGQIITENMTPEAARAWAKIATAKTIRPTASAAPKPAATTSKPASAPAPPSPRLTRAAEFATPELRMTKAEFATLTPADKSRFSTSGGRLV
jgi:hypothetical protein